MAVCIVSSISPVTSIFRKLYRDQNDILITLSSHFLLTLFYLIIYENKTETSDSTFHDGIGFKDLLLDPRVLTADCRQELQDQLRTFCLPGSRLTTANYMKNTSQIWHDNY